ncbi:DUF488 family protein [Haloferula sp. BvORR071]|uniref:DUF488 domain-containing protein n=1 Tax=Haloferula sp. BvORR071 TaxID=1396141 RepID=UPI000554A14A|nr:DUF488 family protein [Haloferula sp. BvORR071]
MPAIRTKCVTETMDRKHDGLRILVTRYIPRGVRGTRYQVWMPNLAPSEALLKSLQGGKIPWSQFAKSYQAELFEGGTIDKRNPRIKNHGQKFTLRLLKELAAKQPVTLMCSCEPDEERCHRHLLRKVLGSSKI